MPQSSSFGRSARPCDTSCDASSGPSEVARIKRQHLAGLGIDHGPVAHAAAVEKEHHHGATILRASLAVLDCVVRRVGLLNVDAAFDHVAANQRQVAVWIIVAQRAVRGRQRRNSGRQTS